jgi:hypothetical protein
VRKRIKLAGATCRKNAIWAVLLAVIPPGCGKTQSTTSTGEGAAHLPPTTAATTAPATTQAQSNEEQLYGTWVAKDVDVKLGEVKIELVFRKTGTLKLAAWSDIPFVGQVKNKKGPFEVNGDIISSEAIRGGTSVRFWFDGAQLVIQYKQGKTIRFDRQ